MKKTQKVVKSNLVRVSLTFFVCSTLGCFSESGPKTYEVTGTLSVHGESLPYGVVRFYSPRGRGVVNARIGPNGSYSVNLEEGAYTVAVEAIPPYKPPEGGSAVEIDLSKVPKSRIPEKYRKPQWSPLKYEVSSTKENVFNVDI